MIFKRQTREIAQSRKKIYQGARTGLMACAKSFGPMEDERDPDTVLEEMLLIEEPVFAEHVAVIGRHHNRRVLQQSGVL